MPQSEAAAPLEEGGSGTGHRVRACNLSVGCVGYLAGRDPVHCGIKCKQFAFMRSLCKNMSGPGKRSYPPKSKTRKRIAGTTCTEIVLCRN
eukprot:1112569-Rhodomonas_salina.1